MKYTKTAALVCALLLCAGSVQAAEKKQENVLPQRFSDAMTWNLQNRPEDITITKVAVPADHSSQGQPSGGNLPPKPAGEGPITPSPGGFNPPDHITQGSAARNVTENGTLEDQVFGSTGDDENALRITGAAVTLRNVEIMKQKETPPAPKAAISTA